jgi:hypothetical protein
MASEEIKLPDIDTLSILSGLPEGIRANDLSMELQKDMVRLGKPEKEAAAVIKKVQGAYAEERNKAVEACYSAGYLKGLADMAQRFKYLLESRGELQGAQEAAKHAAE